MSIAALAPIARRQLGLVTVAQVHGVLTHEQLRHLTRTGALEPVRRGVSRIAGTPESWEQMVLAACLSRPGSFASHATAAALWGLENFARSGIEVTVLGCNRARLAGVHVHETQRYGPGHTSIREGIPVSSAARTVCDLTAASPGWLVERAVDDLLRRGALSLRQLAAVDDALRHRGRRRSTVMRDILQRRLPGYEPGESAPERRIANLLVRSGLPEPHLQHRVKVGARTLRLDLAYPNERIAIEYDGWAFHSTRSAFDRDRERANDLVVLGMQVLRFTSASNDDQIVETVRAALTRRATGS